MGGGGQNADAANPDIILDFFAGSGTTAHAVMALNAQDGGNRKFILVQLPELIDKAKSKTAYDFVKNELKKNEPKISDITIERVKRAGAKLKEGLLNQGLNTDFSIYEISQKPELISDENGELSLKIQNTRNLTPKDMALNLAMSAGVRLDENLECVITNKLYKYGTNLFVIKCDQSVLEVVKKHKEAQIFIDAYECDDGDLEAFLNILAHTDERLFVVK